MSTDDPKSPTDSYELSTIIAAVHGALRDAQQQQLQESYVRRMEMFFPATVKTAGGGTGGGGAAADLAQPRMVTVGIPKPGGRTEQKQVPLFALVPHNDLHIEEMEVRMKVKPTEVQAQNGPPTIKASLASAADAGEHLAELYIRFRAHPPVEGVARLNDELVKTI